MQKHGQDNHQILNHVVSLAVVVLHVVLYPSVHLQWQAHMYMVSSVAYWARTVRNFQNISRAGDGIIYYKGGLEMSLRVVPKPDDQENCELILKSL